MKKSMTLTLPARKPRNPLVGLARARLAGVHGSGGGAQRQRLRAALRSEIAQALSSP
jgi:hypothetical protein